MLKKVDVEPLLTNLIGLDDVVEEGFEAFGSPGVLKVQIQF